MNVDAVPVEISRIVGDDGRSSDGMGLLEFLEWVEDMKAEPVLAVFAGYALHGETVPAGPELQPFVQEALDVIEYVTGDVSTKWGAQRARDGHPAPFKLRYVEIGNEDGFGKQKTYDARHTRFHDTIKAKYPQIKLGPSWQRYRQQANFLQTAEIARKLGAVKIDRGS